MQPVEYYLAMIAAASLLTGCGSVQTRTVTVIETTCSTVPYIPLSNKDIDKLLDNDLFRIIDLIDKQSRIIDNCKGN